MVTPEQFPADFVPDWENAPAWARWWVLSPTDDPYLNSFRAWWSDVEPVLGETRWGSECWTAPKSKHEQEDYGFIDVPDWKAIKMQRPAKRAK